MEGVRALGGMVVLGGVEGGGGGGLGACLERAREENEAVRLEGMVVEGVLALCVLLMEAKRMFSSSRLSAQSFM